MGTALALLTSLAACGGGGFGGFFGGSRNDVPSDQALAARERAAQVAEAELEQERRGNSTIWSIFGNSSDPNTTVEVNKYIWNATLDVLNFLPIESVDPFTGVIVTGYGTPPGGGRAYRATAYIQDTALDARSLKLALQTRGGGPVSRETARAVEDAILTRARQLRVRDSRL
ncbi:DUF3576 domain-containing protein [Tabrizicola sp. DMG-N-6]|uniref:DUF3576 domain-containing protein n=2 Tax=Szabonella alba TaxID=2804194 RepID=A0A8K0VEB2_9RHOB|nr:DUF3576 domain-containing protein [Szabonella alba]